jgi:hypothetical protein
MHPPSFHSLKPRHRPNPQDPARYAVFDAGISLDPLALNVQVLNAPALEVSKRSLNVTTDPPVEEHSP